MFSIIIPSFNNIDYLKVAIESLKKNSFFKNEIIIHLNIGADGSIKGKCGDRKKSELVSHEWRIAR